MTERASDVEARIGAVRQLEAVVIAMRGIAAARTREAHKHLNGIRAYAQTIADAIGHALLFPAEVAPAAEPRRHAEREAIILLCAEQGFVGKFNERLLDTVLDQPATTIERSKILLVGDRGLTAAAGRGLAIDWSTPMVAHAGEAEALAGRVVDELYRRLERGVISRVRVIHSIPGPKARAGIVNRVLVPFDFRRFPLAHKAQPPLIALSPQVLTARLAEEYVFAELCEAVMLSFAAENEARMRAMIAARTNVTRTLGDLTARFRRLRQEEITSEIVELASGGAGRGDS